MLQKKVHFNNKLWSWLENETDSIIEMRDNFLLHREGEDERENKASERERKREQFDFGPKRKYSDPPHPLPADRTPYARDATARTSERRFPRALSNSQKYTRV